MSATTRSEPAPDRTEAAADSTGTSPVDRARSRADLAVVLGRTFAPWTWAGRLSWWALHWIGFTIGAGRDVFGASGWRLWPVLTVVALVSVAAPDAGREPRRTLRRRVASELGWTAGRIAAATATGYALAALLPLATCGLPTYLTAVLGSQLATFVVIVAVGTGGQLVRERVTGVAACPVPAPRTPVPRTDVDE
ncbi:hypothetical protein [Virgisporangium aliadipatigenens]|nr:hypothetical protein [Virgisporangium aliadipatigenens]